MDFQPKMDSESNGFGVDNGFGVANGFGVKVAFGVDNGFGVDEWISTPNRFALEIRMFTEM